MQELNNLEASVIKAGGCGKYLREIKRAARLWGKGRMTDAAFDFVTNNSKKAYKACKSQ